MTTNADKSLIFVCRPGASGQALAEQLTNLGYPAIHTPSLVIVPKLTDLPAKAFDTYIFISPTAVSTSFALGNDWLSDTATIVAVGSSTAKTLYKRGVKKVITPEIYSSEGLLEMPELQTLNDRRVLIVKGVGGRALLEDTLIERGADCQSWSVYSREPQVIEMDHWHAYAKAETRALTCASNETLDAFEAQRQHHGASKPAQIFVASERIADHASSLGYTGIIQVGGATNELFIAAIKQQHS